MKTKRKYKPPAVTKTVEELKVDKWLESAKDLPIPEGEITAHQKIEGEIGLYLFKTDSEWGVFSVNPINTRGKIQVSTGRGIPRLYDVVAIKWNPIAKRKTSFKKASSKDLIFKNSKKKLT